MESSEPQPKTIRLEPLHSGPAQVEKAQSMKRANKSIGGRFRLTNLRDRFKTKTEPAESSCQQEVNRGEERADSNFSEEYLALVNKLRVNLSKQYFERKRSSQFVKERGQYSVQEKNQKRARHFSVRNQRLQDLADNKQYVKCSVVTAKKKLTKPIIPPLQKGGEKVRPFLERISHVEEGLKDISLLKDRENNKRFSYRLKEGSCDTQLGQDKSGGELPVVTYRKKLDIVRQSLRKKKHKRSQIYIKTQEKQNRFGEKQVKINPGYQRTDELCFHIEVLIDIYECCNEPEIGQSELLKRLKGYVLGNKKLVQGSVVINDDISRLDELFCDEVNRNELRGLIFLQRVLVVFAVDLVANSILQKHVNELKQILQSLVGLYLYFLYELKQRRGNLSPFAERSLSLLQGSVRRYNMHFKKEIASLSIFVYKKLFLIMKSNHILMSQVRILITEFESRNVSINRAFYELLKLYAIFLNSNERLIERNFSLMKTFATCPSPYLTRPAVKPYTLVLDLDQTLVYSYDNFNKLQIFLRPFVKEFLNLMSSSFQIVIFTSSMPSYSEEIIDRLPGISYKLFRYHATRIKNKTIKDLSRLGRPLEKLVIVDNEEDNFALQRENGIKIGDWVATDPADQQLNVIGLFLANMVEQQVSDVRPYLAGYRQFRKKYC